MNDAGCEEKRSPFRVVENVLQAVGLKEEEGKAVERLQISFQISVFNSGFIDQFSFLFHFCRQYQF